MFNVGDKVVVKTDSHFGYFTGKTGVVAAVHDDGDSMPIEVVLDNSKPVFDDVMKLLFGSSAIPFDEKELALLED
jgi:ribosomal protein L21E